jgi:hypothetical protein
MSCLGLVDAYRGGGDPTMPFAYRAVWACYENRSFARRCDDLTQEDVAAEIGASRSTVGLATADLAERGIIRVERRRRRPPVIHLLRTYTNSETRPEPGPLTPENHASTRPVDDRNSGATGPVDVGNSGANPAELTPEIQAPLYPPERKKESTRVESTRARGSFSRDEIDAKVAEANAGLRQAMTAWNEMVVGSLLPRVAINDDLPPTAIRAMMAVPVADVLAAIAKVGVTPHLRGETGTGWEGATFEWLMRPGKVDHVLRKTYPRFAQRKTPSQQKADEYAEVKAKLNATWARMRAERVAAGDGEGVSA